MVVNPSVPAKTVPEFIAFAKGNPNKVNMASPGNGTATHVFGGLFKMMTGVNLVHVPYRTSYMPDLLSGQVHTAFPPMAFAIAQIRAGKLRALAVTGARRSVALPDVPTVRDSVPGYEADGWSGVVAPKGTSAGIIKKLNSEINAVIADPMIQPCLADLGISPRPMVPAEFGALIAADTQKWAKVIKVANIKVD
jgi:tripartite-type tricarboxylate transporter receptor subunit TctC